MNRSLTQAIASLSLAFASGCAGYGPKLATEPPAAAPEALSLELNSWGQPILSWRIDNQGEVEFREGHRAESGGYDVLIRRFSGGPAQFEQVRTLMDRTARIAPARLPCRRMTMTDTPYGRANWHRAGLTVSLDFNLGCGDRITRRAMRWLGEATTAVQGWAAAQPVVATEQLRAPRPQ